MNSFTQCLGMALILSSSAAVADTRTLPEGQVPAPMVGTWKVLNYVEDTDPVMDTHPEDKLLVGKQYTISGNSIFESGVNKCSGGLSFFEDFGANSLRGGDHSPLGIDMSLGNLYAACKDKSGKNLTAISFRDALGEYSVRKCLPGRQDLPFGAVIIDEETMVGQRNIAFFCMKRVLPVAAIAGVPANPSQTASLNVTVAGSNTASYVAAVVSGSSCATATYPATYTPIAIKITKALGADGTYTLCVKGKSAVEDLQTKPTQVTWEKDTVAPTQVTLTGTPTNLSTAANLNVTVGGAGVAKYKAALKNGTDCAGVTFGAVTPVATKITLAVGAAGPKSLCVKGIDAAGNEQVAPTKFTWTKN